MGSEPRVPVPARVDHDAANRMRTAYWVERLRRLGPTESYRVADGLWRHVRALRPDWPDRARSGRPISPRTWRSARP